MAEDNPFFEEPKKEKKKNVLIDILQSLAIASIISVVLFVFLTPNEVDGVSMMPNLRSGDLLFTSKPHRWFDGTDLGSSLDLEYDRGDVVVFRKEGGNFEEDFVKRVIALPGESIRIEDGVYYINERRMNEFYDLNNVSREAGAFLVDGAASITLGPNEYFVSGDNRDESFDSRDIGPILRDEIKGRVIFRFWPLQDFGIIGSGDFEIL